MVWMLQFVGNGSSNMLREVTGNIFTSQCQTLVNTVNCVGVMGAGVALEFRLRYPAMYDRYVVLCRERRLTIGKLWLYQTPPTDGPHWVLNFPTKKHWKHPSREEYLHAGLRNFVETYRRRRIESVAFPILGASNGGIPEEVAIGIMTDYLTGIDIDVEVYRYDPTAEDDLCSALRNRVDQCSDAAFASSAGLTTSRVALIRRVLHDPGVRNIRQLASYKGIGEKTLRSAVGAVRAMAEAPASDSPNAPLVEMSEPRPAITGVLKLEGPVEAVPTASRTLFD